MIRSLPLRVIVLGLLLAVYAITQSITVHATRKAQKQAGEYKVLQVNLFSGTTRDAIMAHDDILLLNYVKTLTQSNLCASAWVMGDDGKIIIHSDRDQIGKVATDPSFLVAKKSDEILHQQIKLSDGSNAELISVPIELGNQRLGTAAIAFRP